MYSDTLGEIRLFAGAKPPRNWLVCNGQTMSINTNMALYSLLGTTYGGNGTTTFMLPDFSGRLPIHPGKNYPLGKTGGSNTNVLQWSQLPGHCHQIDQSKLKLKCRSATTGGVSSPSPLNSYPGNSGSDFSYNPKISAGRGAALSAGAVEVTAGNVGNSKPLENMMPSLCINFIICIAGYYPSPA
jgi:microcystin-dependent protein